MRTHSLSWLQLQLLLVDCNEYKYEFYLLAVRLHVAVCGGVCAVRAAPASPVAIVGDSLVFEFTILSIDLPHRHRMKFACVRCTCGVILCAAHQLAHNLVSAQRKRTLQMQMDKFIELLNCFLCPSDDIGGKKN